MPSGDTTERTRRFGRRQDESAALQSAPRRALLTTLDQGNSSVSNFLVSVVAARFAGAKGLGAFTFAYAFWLLLAAVHHALVTDPMAIENDAAQPDATSRLQRGLAAELTLGLAATAMFVILGGILIVAGQSTFGVGLLAFAPWLVALEVQDYWRWVGFMQRRPGRALVNDTVFNGVFIVAVAVAYVAGLRSVPAVTAAWGCGALAGALFGLWQFSVRPSLRHGLATLRARPHLSRGLAGNWIVSWGNNEATALLVGLILGPVGLGEFNAAQTLVYGPTLVLVQAGGSIGLPEASAARAAHGWVGLRRIGRFVTAAGVLAVGLVGIVVLFFGRDLLKLVYGPSFAHYWIASDLFAVSVIISAVGLGAILVLKASRHTSQLFRVSVVSLVVSVVSICVLAEIDGVTGAAAAAVASSTIGLAFLLYYKRSANLSEAS